MRSAITQPSELAFRPVTPARWPDLEKLFGARGACAGCWCMWSRRTHADYERNKGPGNKRALKKLVMAGPPPGVLAYLDGEPAGWCAIAPRSEYVRLASSRVLAPVDDKPVWSVVCFFIARKHRHRGISAELLKAAVKFARSRGARIVEGYPIEIREGKVMAALAWAWTGVAETFRRAGFKEVARRSATRPIMRMEL